MHRTLRLALVLHWAMAVGCYQASKGSPEQKSEPTKEPATVSVSVVKPKKENLQSSTQGPGYIQAFEQTPIFAKIAGYVEKWHVDIGDHVSKGKTLAELRIPELDVELKQKEALVAQSEAELKLARETVPSAEAEHRRLKSQYERLAASPGTVNKDDVEEAKLGAEASAARRKMAEVDVEVKAARVEVAKQNRDQVETLRGYKKLTAPFDGIVSRRNINTEDFVQPPTGGKGEPLYVVERRDMMRIFVPVPEADAPWVKPKVPARVRVQALPGREFTAEVTRTSYSLDRTAHTLLAEIDLPNPDDSLRSNMYAYATITLEQPNALTLPASALVTQGDITKGYESFCFVVEEGKLRRTQVQTGTRAANRIQVLKKQETAGQNMRWIDFTGDEVVVQENVASLSDGQEVAVSPSEK